MTSQIGPDEPADLPRHGGVSGSHYDEGRITRRSDADPFWKEVYRAAICRYGENSAENGVEFYQEIGALHVGSSHGATLLRLAESRPSRDRLRSL